MAGRRPVPTALKILRGNPGHRPLNDAEPQPPMGIPEMPKGMSTAAKREWYLIVEQLQAINMLARVDGKALGEYCKLMGLAEAYYKEALKEPMVKEPIMDKVGDHVGDKLKPNPATAAYLACSKTAKSYLIEFGLTPASRSKLKIEPRKPADPLEDMLNNKAGAQATVDAMKESAPLAFNVGALKQQENSGMPVLSEADTNFDA